MLGHTRRARGLPVGVHAVGERERTRPHRGPESGCHVRVRRTGRSRRGGPRTSREGDRRPRHRRGRLRRDTVDRVRRRTVAPTGAVPGRREPGPHQPRRRLRRESRRGLQRLLLPWAGFPCAHAHRRHHRRLLPLPFGHRGTVLAVPHQRDRPRPAAGGVRPRLRHRDVQGVRGGPPAWPGQQRLRRLRQLGRALFASRALRPREAGLNARLNRLADRVLHPEGGAPNAAAAKEYVLALREFHDTDRQRDRQRLDAVERRIEKIEGMLL